MSTGNFPATRSLSTMQSLHLPVLAEARANTHAIIQAVDAVGKANTIQGAARATLSEVRDVFGWAYGIYWQVDQDSDQLHFLVDSGSLGPDFKSMVHKVSLPKGESLPGRAWSEESLIRSTDLQELGVGEARIAMAVEAGMRSSIALPVTLHEKTVGVLEFFASDVIQLSGERSKALTSIARVVSNTISLVHRAQSQAEAKLCIDTVNEVLQNLRNARTPEHGAQITLDILRRTFNWSYATYWEVADSNGREELKLVADCGDVASDLRRSSLDSRFEHGEGTLGRSWQAREMVFTPDLSQEYDCPRSEIAMISEMTSSICMPVFAQGSVVGVMEYFSRHRIRPNKDRFNALRSTAGLLSATVERLSQTLQERAEMQSMIRRVDRILRVARAVAHGDLSKSVEVEGEDSIGMIGEELNAIIESFRNNMSAVGTTAREANSTSAKATRATDQMVRDADNTYKQATQVAESAERVSVNVRTLASGASELGASVVEISKSAHEAADVASRAVEVTKSTNQTISKLGASSEEIGNVIKVITSIAQQTNLLALNATIEAARAGEAGKGFAVVANEVKELAKETAKATEDISQKVEAIQVDTESAVEAINEISCIISQINGIQNNIASAVEEQTATTDEITRNVEEAAEGSAAISDSIMEVAKIAQMTSEAATEAQTAAKALTNTSEELRELTHQFMC